MTLSFWRQSLSPTIHCDAVVIGAGICGLSAALHLERRGLDVRILERGIIGSGASTKNAGFLMRGAAENYAAAIDEYGRDTARLIWRWTEENLAGLRSEGIESLPRYQRIPSCLLALGEEEKAALARSVSLLKQDGFNVDWLEAGPATRTLDSAWRTGLPLAGLINPDDAACNPVEVLHHFASKLKHPVLEGHEVAAIRAARDGVSIATTQAEFRAPHVLICTNAYLRQLGPANLVQPRRGQMLAIRGDTLSLKYSYYANHGYEYFRQTTDGTIVIGGCRKDFADTEVGFDDQATPDVQSAIEDFGRRVLGQSTLEVTARWSGVMGFSPDGLPLIGPLHHGDWPANRVWFCGGFTGHGMSMAYRCARAAIESMLDGSQNPLPISRLSI